jgi:ketosteroid isomerase-like protein
MRSRCAPLSALIAGIAILVIVSGCQASGANGHTGTASASTGNGRQEVSGLLDQYMQALLKKDLAALDRIWTDDLTFVNARGELLGKRDRMDNIKTGATAFKTINMTDQQVRTHGDSAVATFKVALDAQYSGQPGSGNFYVTTAWARPRGTWQMVAVHMTRIGQ